MVTGLKTISHGRDPFPCAPVDIWVNKTDGLHGPRGKLGIKDTLGRKPELSNPQMEPGLPVSVPASMSTLRSRVWKKNIQTSIPHRSGSPASGRYDNIGHEDQTPCHKQFGSDNPESTGLPKPRRQPGYLNPGFQPRVTLEKRKQLDDLPRRLPINGKAWNESKKSTVQPEIPETTELTNPRRQPGYSNPGSNPS